jgi:nitronate monooxygenase
VEVTQSLTDRPFGINLVLEWPQHERLRAALEAGARFVSLTWGDPTPYLRPVHHVGGLVALTVGSAKEAREAVAAGVDVIVAQGWEAGGHVRGEVATLPLVRAVVDAVHPTPVVAAGGLADGPGLAAVLALGASAGWFGTRFVMCEEAMSLPRYRELLAAADEASTLRTTLFDIGWPDAPHRVLRTPTTEAWVRAGRPPPGQRPGEGDIVARWSNGTEIPRYDTTSPRIGLDGDIDALSLWAGQSVGTIRDVLPAVEIVRTIMEDARAALGSAASAVGP